MKKFLGILLIGFCFAAPTTFGGVAFKDVLVVDASSDLLAQTIVTSRNVSANVVTTANVYQLPTKYSVYHVDSTTNTLNFQLVTDNRRVDGQLIVIACTGFSKPISITTNIVFSAPVTANGAVYNVDAVLDTSTANLTIDALGDAIMLQYVKSKGKYMILSSDL